MRGRLVVTNNGDDTCRWSIPRAATTALRVPAGLEPIEPEGPHHLSASPDGTALFVNISYSVVGGGGGPHGAHGNGTMPGFVLKLSTSDGAMIAKTLVDRNPGDNELSPDGATLYVSHYDLPAWTKGVATGNIRDGDSNLIAIDTATMAVKWKVAICPAAHGLRLSRDGNTLYATCAPDEIAVVDLTTTPIGVRRVPLPGFSEGEGCLRCPYAVSVAPDDSVWVASIGPSNGRDGQGGIDVYDPATGEFDPARKLHMLGRALFPAFVAGGRGRRLSRLRPRATGRRRRLRARLRRRRGGRGRRRGGAHHARARRLPERARHRHRRGPQRGARRLRRRPHAPGLDGVHRYCSPVCIPLAAAGRISRRHRGGAVMSIASICPAKKCRRAGAAGGWYTGTMRMQRFVGLAVFPVALALAGCHDHTHGEEGPQADEYVVDCETADGGFAASDEDFAAVVNAEAAGSVMTTPADSLPALTAPAAGATLSAATPPTFTFTATTVATASANQGATMACRAPAGAKRKRVSRFGRVISAIRSELVLERTAEAHCPATSGDKYLLRLQTSSGDPVFTAMLSVTTYTPDAAKWSAEARQPSGSDADGDADARHVLGRGDRRWTVHGHAGADVHGRTVARRRCRPAPLPPPPESAPWRRWR